MSLEFPLYKAPVTKSPCYAGQGVSILSGAASEHCFRMGIGACLVVVCPSCEAENRFNCGANEIGTCKVCHSAVLSDPHADRLISYEEFRSGLGLITKDSEVGLFSEWDLDTEWSDRDPEIVAESLQYYKLGWMREKISRDDIYELLRTPDYETWQGDHWLFHDEKPMIFVGEWTNDDFLAHKGEQTLEDFYISVFGQEFRDIVEGADDVCKYVFQSQDGRVFRGHYDID